MYFRAKVLLGLGLKRSLKETSRNSHVSFKHFKSRFIICTSLSQIPILSSGFMYQFSGLLQYITRNLSCLTELTVFCEIQNLSAPIMKKKQPYGTTAFSLTFRHRASSIQDRHFATLQRTLFIYLINKYISLSDIGLTVHH